MYVSHLWLKGITPRLSGLTFSDLYVGVCLIVSTNVFLRYKSSFLLVFGAKKRKETHANKVIKLHRAQCLSLLITPGLKNKRESFFVLSLLLRPPQLIHLRVLYWLLRLMTFHFKSLFGGWTAMYKTDAK